MKKLALMGFLIMWAGNASAALVWLNNLTVDSYTVTTSGGNYFLIVKVKEDISGTGCATADDLNQFARWGTSVGAFWDYLQRSIIAAEAQGRKVNIRYDNTQCSTEGGRFLEGVTVLPEPVQ